MKHSREHGFALPSVIVASLVMFTVLVALVGSVTSVKSALDSQYYEGLASDAAESGLIQAKQCAFSSTFTTSVTVYPQTNCAGVTQSGQPTYIIDHTNTAQYSSNRFRSTYSIKLATINDKGRTLKVTGSVQLFRTSDTGLTMPIRTVTKTLNLQIVNKPDPFGSRASKRFWHFGANAGLDFGVNGSNLPTPVKLQSPLSATQPHISHEGITTVSDQNGNFQFNSDGLNVWDRTGAYMSGATGMYGGASATQAVVSFPLNPSRTAYAVVSNTGQGNDGLGELYMNTITLMNDATGNNGKGAMTSKNVQLGQGRNLSDALPAPMTAPKSEGANNPINPGGGRTDMSYSGEALNAAPLVDGTGYVVYTFNNRTGRVIAFTIKDGKEVGVAQTAVTFPSDNSTSSGSGGCWRQSEANGNWSLGGFGTINFSEDYSKMLLTAGAWCGTTDDRGGSFFLFDVDPLTGALTQRATWTFHGEINSQAGASNRHGAYSADFSPTAQYVYVTQIYPGYLFRYSLADLSTSKIEASRWKVGLSTSLGGPTTGGNNAVFSGGGQVRRGPDGRMYISDRGYYQKYIDDTNGGTALSPGPLGFDAYVSYISSPDSFWPTPASIGYMVDGLKLPSGSASVWGLPQMATVYTPQIYVY